ncbi:MAG: DUF2726 domain-containing protein, partial [Azoarcus sp.]|nr:DUF2726 domain-containing protein [Azoarcus sp.]
MMIVFTIIIVTIVILLLVKSKQQQDRRRAREAAWFAAARTQKKQAGITSGGGLGSGNDVFRIKPAWFSPEAISLYDTLTEAFPRMIVFSHVSLARVITLRGASNWENQSETARQSIDFLICKKTDT